MVHGTADSSAMKGFGKPGAGELHARFDERGLETRYGYGTGACNKMQGQRRTYWLSRQPPTLASYSDKRTMDTSNTLSVVDEGIDGDRCQHVHRGDVVRRICRNRRT